MVGYLVQLMEEGRFEQSLRLAEQQLLQGGLSLNELATLNLVVCRCRLGLQDSYGAINPGLLAVKLAGSAREWDLLGRALLNVGTAYLGTRHYEKALQHFEQYLEHLGDYSTAQRFEGAVWKGIGVARQSRLESQKAIEALERACRWYAAQENARSVFSCTHDLVNTYLQLHAANPEASLEPVARLLRDEKAIADKHPSESYFAGYYQLDQAAYYMHRGQFGRAVVSATKAREARRTDLNLAFHTYMIIQECSSRQGDTRQAIGYALAARVTALQLRRFDLESLANRVLADLLGRPDAPAATELDGLYEEMQLRLEQFLPGGQPKPQN